MEDTEEELERRGKEGNIRRAESLEKGKEGQEAVKEAKERRKGGNRERTGKEKKERNIRRAESIENKRKERKRWTKPRREKKSGMCGGRSGSDKKGKDEKLRKREVVFRKSGHVHSKIRRKLNESKGNNTNGTKTRSVR